MKPLAKFSLGAGLFALLAYANRKTIKEGAKEIINYAFTREQDEFLKDLHPSYRNVFRKFIAEIQTKLPYKVLITSGYRSFQKQLQLHSENPANAKPGKSMHNYGLAIDINLINKNNGSMLRKSDSSAAWEKSGVVKIANKLGLKWGGGGNFGSYHDPVHFEIPLGGSKLYALALKQFGSDSRIIGNRVVLGNTTLAISGLVAPDSRNCCC